MTRVISSGFSYFSNAKVNIICSTSQIWWIHRLQTATRWSNNVTCDRERALAVMFLVNICLITSSLNVKCHWFSWLIVSCWCSGLWLNVIWQLRIKYFYDFSSQVVCATFILFLECIFIHILSLYIVEKWVRVRVGQVLQNIFETFIKYL